MNQQQQLNLFLDAINAATKKTIIKIVGEANEKRDSELKEARAAAEKRAASFVSGETERLREKQNRKVSAAAAELRKTLALGRRELAESVFAEVSDRLTEFAASGEYPSFLEESVKKIAKSLDGRSFVLYLRGEDMRLADRLRALSPQCEDVLPDERIKTGGCIASAENGGLVLDDRLETRLEENKAWFYENSDLTI